MSLWPSGQTGRQSHLEVMWRSEFLGQWKEMIRWILIYWWREMSDGLAWCQIQKAAWVQCKAFWDVVVKPGWFLSLTGRLMFEYAHTLSVGGLMWWDQPWFETKCTSSVRERFHKQEEQHFTAGSLRCLHIWFSLNDYCDLLRHRNDIKAIFCLLVSRFVVATALAELAHI